jgi:hypothetical protein
VAALFYSSLLPALSSQVTIYGWSTSPLVLAQSVDDEQQPRPSVTGAGGGQVEQAASVKQAERCNTDK